MSINAYRIAITTPGKYKILKEDTIKSLIPLIRDDQSEMRVNALKVMKSN